MSKLTKGRLCVVHNNVCEASSKLEVTEQRVIAYLVSIIDKDDEDFKDYPMQVKDLAALLDIKRKDFYKEVKLTTKALLSKPMSLKRLDGKAGEIQVSWLSGADYLDGDGTVILRFDKGLKPYLLQLKEFFTKFPLQDVTKFRSQFSMPIYLLCKQYLTIGNRIITLEDLRKKLDIVDQYAQYGALKLKVLNTAKKDINSKTTLEIDFTEIREGRKVVAINFLIKQKVQQQKETDLFSNIDATENDTLRSLAMYFDLELAQEYLHKYGEEYCAKKIVLEKNRENRKSPAGFLKRAIEHDWKTANTLEKETDVREEKTAQLALKQLILAEEEATPAQEIQSPELEGFLKRMVR